MSDSAPIFRRTGIVGFRASSDRRLSELPSLKPTLPPTVDRRQSWADFTILSTLTRTEGVKLLAPTTHAMTEQEAGQGIIVKLAANFRMSPQ